MKALIGSLAVFLSGLILWVPLYLAMRLDGFVFHDHPAIFIYLLILTSILMLLSVRFIWKIIHHMRVSSNKGEQVIIVDMREEGEKP